MLCWTRSALCMTQRQNQYKYHSASLPHWGSVQDPCLTKHEHHLRSFGSFWAGKFLSSHSRRHQTLERFFRSPSQSLSVFRLSDRFVWTTNLPPQKKNQWGRLNVTFFTTVSSPPLTRSCLFFHQLFVVYVLVPTSLARSHGIWKHPVRLRVLRSCSLEIRLVAFKHFVTSRVLFVHQVAGHAARVVIEL